MPVFSPKEILRDADAGLSGRGSAKEGMRDGGLVIEAKPFEMAVVSEPSLNRR